jgi:RNA polymerase sigma-70 factor, ECF subfamily
MRSGRQGVRRQLLPRDASSGPYATRAPEGQSLTPDVPLPTQPFPAIRCQKVVHTRTPSEPRGLVDEQQLLREARAGDPAAERALYDAHVDRIYRLAYRLAGSDDLAQDFTQETFIRAFERLHDFRGESSLSTWLHSIALSVSLNGLRKVKRFHTRELDLDEAQGHGWSAREAEPDLKARLAKAIDALAPGYRTVFVMHDVEGYTHEEIATALGLQPGTSKAQLSRARAKLREALADFAGEWTT